MANLENAGRRSAERTEHFGLKQAYSQWLLRLEPWTPVAVLGFGLVLWQWLSISGYISRLFFPAPTIILSTLSRMVIDGTLFPHIWATVSRLLLGFLIGGTTGLLLGLSMGWSQRLRTIVDPVIAAIHPIPKIAIFPLIMIIFGIGESSKVVAIAIAAFFPMLINSMAGVRQLNPVYFEVTHNYGANAWKTFSRVVFPGSLPSILAGLRLALNTSMVIAIAVELLAAKEGLGVVIWFSWQTLRIEELYASLIVIALLGVAINLLLQFLTRRLAPWSIDETERHY